MYSYLRFEKMGAQLEILYGFRCPQALAKLEES